MAANPEIERYIYDAAVKRGISPEVAVEVSRREALNVFDPNQPDLGGDDRSSFGPFQLHYGGRSKSMPNAGLGDEFTAKTGLDASDPKTWKQQVDFSLDYAKNHGWGSWMGAKAAGITGMAGIDGRPATGMVASANQASAPSTSNAVAEAEPDLAPVFDNFPRRSLADDLSESVADAASPKVSRGDAGGLSGLSTSEGDGFIPAPEFASAIPETPPPATVTTPAEPAADTSSPLADLFKVADIGQSTAVDPVTGLPVLARSRRAAG